MDFRIETQLRQEISDAWKLVDQYRRAAIESAVLPEGWVAVPKEPTLAMLDCLRSDITSNLEKRYQAMLAAAPKAQAEKQEPFPFSADRVTYHKTAASPLDLMECLQDRPVEPSKAVQGKCVVQAEKQEPVAWRYQDSRGRYRYRGYVPNFDVEYKLLKPVALYTAASVKQEPCVCGEPSANTVHRTDGPCYQQEPVKDEPVAWCVAYDDPRMGRIHSNPSMYKPELEALISRAGNPLALVPLYTRPQDLTAEVEFMQGKYEEMLEEWLPQKQRIAALEEAAREAREMLQYKLHVVDAIAKLDAVLGNA